MMRYPAKFRRRARFGRHEGGASAVEFALTAPAFFALMFGGLQCALMLWTQLGLQHAAERASRCAAINASLCGSSSLVQSYAVSQELATGVAGANFTLTTETCGQAVTATANVSFIVSTVALSAKSCFPK